MRTVIAMLEIDENQAIQEDLGTIEYLEREFGWLENSDIYLQDARIIDNDDEFDIEALQLADKIFKGEI
jgi:hypothetical protein